MQPRQRMGLEPGELVRQRSRRPQLLRRQRVVAMVLTVALAALPLVATLMEPRVGVAVATDPVLQSGKGLGLARLGHLWLLREFYLIFCISYLNRVRFGPRVSNRHANLTASTKQNLTERQLSPSSRQ